MANAALRLTGKGRALLLGTGFLVLCGLLAGPLASHRAAAQQKKDDNPFTDKKGDPKKTDPKKDDGKKDVPDTPSKAYDILVGGGAEQVNFINEQIEAKWKDNKIEPSARCTDYEFVRRATLDLVGRIAKPAEIAKFMSWPEKERRSKLIQELLDTEEYAENFANIFANLLMTRTGSKVHHMQMQVWLTDELVKKNCDWSKVTTSLLSAQGTTNGKNDEPAVNFILAHLGENVPGNPQEAGKFTMVPVTSRITRLFLGLRTQCTQCHDHPFNDEWRQEHFWGINGFLRQVEAPDGHPNDGKKKKGMPKQEFQYKLVDNASFNVKGFISYERRSGQIEVTKSFFLDGTKLPAKFDGTRRQQLAKFVIGSPYFAKAFVNRMWGHFMGRGFTKEVDDFGEHSPVSHPELLDKLAKDWSTSGYYNPRTLIRWICNSRAYGLSSVANKTNDKSDTEQFFGRMLLKAMTPEQLFESLMTATEAKDSRTAEAKKKMREDWMNKLIVNFGDDEGNEGTFNGTVVQALLMMNGQEINNAIMDKEFGTVAVAMKRWDKMPKNTAKAATDALKAVITDLYTAALNRHPSDAIRVDPKTKEKYSEWGRLINKDRMKLKGAEITPQQYYQLLSEKAFVEAYAQDLMWALLNSNEFILNH
jgi:hypothetical protein